LQTEVLHRKKVLKSN